MTEMTTSVQREFLQNVESRIRIATPLLTRVDERAVYQSTSNSPAQSKILARGAQAVSGAATTGSRPIIQSHPRMQDQTSRTRHNGEGLQIIPTDDALIMEDESL